MYGGLQIGFFWFGIDCCCVCGFMCVCFVVVVDNYDGYVFGWFVCFCIGVCVFGEFYGQFGVVFVYCWGGFFFGRFFVIWWWYCGQFCCCGSGRFSCWFGFCDCDYVDYGYCYLFGL